MKGVKKIMLRLQIPHITKGIYILKMTMMMRSMQNFLVTQKRKTITQLLLNTHEKQLFKKKYSQHLIPINKLLQIYHLELIGRTFAGSLIIWLINQHATTKFCSSQLCWSLQSWVTLPRQVLLYLLLIINMSAFSLVVLSLIY